MTELQIQTKAWQEVWTRHPQTRHLFYHVPNGGYRNKIEAKQLQASGVVPGVPDLELKWKGKSYPMEVKKPTGEPSDKQIKLHAIWAEHGFDVPIFDTWESIVEYVESIIL